MVSKRTAPPFEAEPGEHWYDPDQHEQPEQTKPNGNGAHMVEPLPLTWFEPFIIHDLPMRAWLHAGHYIRKHVVMTVAPGAWGKTSLVLINAIEMALGRGLIGPDPPIRVRVLYWNGEDPRDEIMRRIAAICLHYDIDQHGLKGWLVIGDKLKPDRRFAYVDQRQQIQMHPHALMQFEQFIRENRIEQAILDPLVAFHRVPEGNNTAMEELVSTLGGVADRCDMCIELNHHTRKPQGNFEITVDDSRGAGAIANAARSVRVLNRMTAEEAKMPGITDEDRRHYLRVSRDKSNLIPASKATWIHLVSVQLPNGPNGDPGDNVQAVEHWDYPQPFDNVSADDMRWMHGEAGRAEYLKSPRALEKWIGAPLAQRLKLDITNEAHRKRLTAIISVWISKGVLAVNKRKDVNRKEREFVVPGDWNEDIE